MKKLSLDEEFSFNGYIRKFVSKDGAIQLEKVRPSKVKPEFTPPLISEVVAYFQKHGYSLEAAHKFWDYYSKLEWHDKNNERVKNWKAKCIGVWFKDENKTTHQPNQQPGIKFFQ